VFHDRFEADFQPRVYNILSVGGSCRLAQAGQAITSRTICDSVPPGSSV
jgi:hypothetical protein